MAAIQRARDDETAVVALTSSSPSIASRPNSFNNRMDHHQHQSSPKKMDISPVAPRRKRSIKLGSM